MLVKMIYVLYSCVEQVFGLNKS